MPGFFKASKGKYKQLPTGTQGQQQLNSNLVAGLNGGLQQSGLDYLQGILSGDSAAYDAFAAPYQRQFEEEIVPGLAERFSGLGAQKSSAFGQSLSSAGAKLQEQLAAQKGTLQQNALSQLMQFIQQSQQPQFQYAYQQGQPSWFSQIAPALGSAVGQFAGSMAAKGGGTLSAGGGMPTSGSTMGNPLSYGGGGQYTVTGM